MIHLIKNSLHKSGDKHSDLLGIKRFLNLNRRIKISDLSTDYNFCAKTQTALQQFQQSKGLTRTGRMNIETWRAIGDEINAHQFEMMFGRSSNVGALRNIIYAHKLRRMFPTTTHSELVKYAFQEGGGRYGDGNGGLSTSETAAIDYGSKLTDTYFGTGGKIDIPITLIISEAPKHAMTPEGMTVEDAMKAAHEWISQNTSKARKTQREADAQVEKSKQELAARHQQSNGKPVPSPAPNPYIDSGKMVSGALTDFGRACHTYMDSVSPAHHGWQEYKMPKTIIKMTDPETGEVIGENETVDVIKYIQEGLQHAAEESAPPTDQQKEEATLYMRGAFLTTFTNKWFKRAVKSESERQKTYNFLKTKGCTWSEDLGGAESPQPQIPKDNVEKI